MLELFIFIILIYCNKKSILANYWLFNNRNTIVVSLVRVEVSNYKQVVFLNKYWSLGLVIINVDKFLFNQNNALKEFHKKCWL